jgi:hypothetical protein
MNSAAKWQKYKSDFLCVNRCTAAEFEQDYVAFMGTKPDDKAYRQFARKYHITIHADPYIPKRLQVILSVNVSAIKVMATSHTESENAIMEIMSGAEKRH